MMKFKKGSAILIISFSLVFTSLPAVLPSSTIQIEAKTKKVYVATKSGKKYHVRKTCRTLRRSKSIKKMKLSKAKKLGYKKCKVCH